MLTEKITEPWRKFRITGAGAKEAFLHVISAYSTYLCDKKSILDYIVLKCPEVLEDLVAADMLAAFKEFCRLGIQRREFISPAELNWTFKYVADPDVKKEMEKLVYRSLLLSIASDRMRRDFKWSIDENARGEIARDILENSNLNSKRKMEIAKEFGEPSMQFENEYLKKLLWDKHYDKAKGLIASNPLVTLPMEKQPNDEALNARQEIIISAIVSNIDAGHINDAGDIAARFLPDRRDIAEEIQRIKTALS